MIKIKREKVWYECDYCGKDMTQAGLVNSDGYGSIYDSELSGYKTIDICDNSECYKKHLEIVANELADNEASLFYPLDILESKFGAEYEKLKDNKFKIKWNKEDKWHIYKKEILIKLLIPVYEKYVISGNGK